MSEESNKVLMKTADGKKSYLIDKGSVEFMKEQKGWTAEANAKDKPTQPANPAQNKPA